MYPKHKNNLLPHPQKKIWLLTITLAFFSIDSRFFFAFSENMSLPDFLSTNVTAALVFCKKNRTPCSKIRHDSIPQITIWAYSILHTWPKNEDRNFSLSWLYQLRRFWDSWAVTADFCSSDCSAASLFRKVNPRIDMILFKWALLSDPISFWDFKGSDIFLCSHTSNGKGLFLKLRLRYGSNPKSEPNDTCQLKYIYLESSQHKEMEKKREKQRHGTQIYIIQVSICCFNYKLKITRFQESIFIEVFLDRKVISSENFLNSGLQ